MNIDLSGRGGLADKFYGDITDSSGSPQLRYTAKDGQMVQGQFNPIRKYGYLAPIPSGFTTITESSGAQNFTNQFRAVVYDAVNSQVFAAENGDLLWGTPTGSLTSWVGATAGSPISGSALHFTDLAFYQINGSVKIFAPYMKAGGGDILMASVNTDGTFASTTATWFSSSCSGGGNTGPTSDVFIIPSDNNLAYIHDGYIIYELDGTTNGGSTGTATTVITFPPTFTCVDGLDYRGNLLTAIQNAPSYGANSTIAAETPVVGVHFWDRDTTTSSQKDFVPMAGVREIRKLYKTPEGYVRAIVISSQDKVQIRHFTGSSFTVIAELGSNAYPVYRSSFTYSGSFAVWLGYDGIIYAHGRTTANDPEGLFIIGDTTTEMGANPLMGAMLALDNSANRVGVLWSGKTNGGTVKNRYLYPHSTGTAPFAGNPYTGVKFLPKLSTVNFIDVFCAPTQNTGSTNIATIDVYINQSSTSIKTFQVTKDLASRGYVTIPVTTGYVNSIQLKVTWDVTNTIGVDDFLPSFASVDYTPEENYG